jgi:hypothetical protein
MPNVDARAILDALAPAPKALQDAYDAACAVLDDAAVAYQARLVAGFIDEDFVDEGLVVLDAVSAAYWAAKAAVEDARAAVEDARGR